MDGHLVFIQSESRTRGHCLRINSHSEHHRGQTALVRLLDRNCRAYYKRQMICLCGFAVAQVRLILGVVIHGSAECLSLPPATALVAAVLLLTISAWVSLICFICTKLINGHHLEILQLEQCFTKVTRFVFSRET